MGQGETVCVFSSGEKPVWPDGKALDTVSSGEKPVWPDGPCIMLLFCGICQHKVMESYYEEEFCNIMIIK